MIEFAGLDWNPEEVQQQLFADAQRLLSNFALRFCENTGEEKTNQFDDSQHTSIVEKLMFDNPNVKHGSKRSNESKVADEIAMFASNHESINATNFWIANHKRLPILNRVFMHLKPIVVSNACIERLFSEATTILSDIRMNFGSEMIESMMMNNHPCE